jgi:hypothetical protein
MISILAPEDKQRGLTHVQKLRVELQAVVDSKKVKRGNRKCDLNSRVSFLKPKVKQSMFEVLS